MNGAARILVVDDEEVIREGCERALLKSGYLIAKAENGQRAIEILEAEPYDIVLLDLMMAGIDGFGVLKWIMENRPGIQVIVITGFATVSEAVKAMRLGAFDFVGKPFSPEYIRIVVARAAENISLIAERERLREEKARDLRIIVEEHSRLTTVIGCIVEGVIVTDHDLRVVHCNPAAVQMLKLQADPVVGKPISASIDDPDILGMIGETLGSGNVVTMEFAPGRISRLHVRAFCAPVRTETGKVLGSVTTFEDITLHKQIDRMKSDFVAMVAHELRAPLASIEQMIYASSLACTSKNDVCERTLDRMTARTTELIQLIENLLNLSKLESGRVPLNLEPVRGDEVVREVVDQLGPAAGKKGIGLSLDVPPDVWWLNADREYLHVAVANVIENAIKYTPQGGSVDVSTRVEAGLAKIRVRDSGIGISAQDLPFIFDRFFRAKNQSTRGITGSGLGLSLVEKVVEDHHGHVEVESTPGQGSTFTLGFPVVDSPSAGPGEERRA
jgi:two-component system phosphate regulon sensor histidine kinase PhoR